jgi:tetratricopeptide (TPR) repeat protein
MLHKPVLLAALLLSICTAAFSQITLTQLPSGGNKKAWTGERVGLTDITIHYDRPAVKGRSGKIWGGLVPVGFTDQGFGSSKAAPWRAGANENTTIEFSGDVRIEGQPLKAGKYALFIAYDSAQPTLIFSTNASSWGSYYYKEAEDALRVKLKPQTLTQPVEWLRYAFYDQQESSAVIALEWDNLRIPFKVEVDYVADQIASFRKELRSERGFYWLPWEQAAQWALQHNTNLEEALLWSDSATGPSFGGSQMFQPWVTKAQLLEKLGRQAAADSIMKAKLPLANMAEVHQYGRSLLQQKKAKAALAVFQANHKKYPGDFTTLVGLARGYSATGDYKNALKYARQALPLSPNDTNKQFLTTAVQKLESGKDIN